MNNTKKIFSIIIAIICIAVLGYLVFFFGDSSNQESEITTLAQSEYTISFDANELKYKEGTSFLTGVTATDEKGNDLTKFVTVSCKPTKDISKKILSYSINKSGYKITSVERTLIIDSSYDGPTITVTDSIEVPINQIKNLSSIVAKSDAIKTDDGFGNECGITATINAGEIQIGDYVATVTAQNVFGDSTSAKLSVTVVEADTSIIKLSASSVTISRGDKFDPLEYVVSANDSKYGDLKDSVSAINPVNTDEAGIYTVEYKILGIEALKDETAKLYVTVN